MHFKDFITRQRLAIVAVGFFISAVAILGAELSRYQHLWGALCADLAVSSITVVFTALVIDYLHIREEHNRTDSVAGLAEDELAATCFRTQWRMARVFGMEPHGLSKDHMSTREEVRAYVDDIRNEVDSYLDEHSLTDEATPINEDMLPKYIERLQVSRSELEQILMLYEYAMVYSLRERVLTLRNELQTADNILGLIDAGQQLNAANASLIRIVSQSVHDAIVDTLAHGSRTEKGTPIHAKDRHLP